MDEFKRKQIVKCLEVTEQEIAKEKEMKIEEVRCQLRKKADMQKVLSQINEDCDFDKWCKSWWKRYYPDGSWKDAFRIYVFEQFLDCDADKNGLLNVEISLSQEDLPGVLAKKLRETGNIDVKDNNDEQSYLVTGMFGFLKEMKVRKDIEKFCGEYYDAVNYVRYCHSKG